MRAHIAVNRRLINCVMRCACVAVVVSADVFSWKVFRGEIKFLGHAVITVNQYSHFVLFVFFFLLVLPGMLGVDEYAVVYPPNGVIPFHGFAMVW